MQLLAIVILSPLAFLYSALSKLRNYFYDKKIFKSIQTDLKVISVGNISAGGSGKTPLVLMLTKYLKQQHKTSVLLRGYKAELEGQIEKLNEVDGRKFGDEASLHYYKNPSVPVYIGANRAKAVECMHKQETLDVVVCDDAFQHRKLARDLDIVLIDCMQEPAYWWPLPLGRGRESWKALQRAQIVVLNKWHECLESNKKYYQNILQNYPHLLVCKSRYECMSPYPLKALNSALGPTSSVTNVSKDEISFSSDLFKRVMLLSSIAKPESFLESFKEKYPDIEIVYHYKFPDHHDYDEGDIDRIFSVQKKWQVDAIISTEKDAMKLLHIPDEFLPNTWILPIEMQISEESEKFYAKIDSLFS